MGSGQQRKASRETTGGRAGGSYEKHVIVWSHDMIMYLYSASLPLGWNLADRLVFKKVKEGLGFQRCKIYVVGSAPTRQDVHEFYMSYNMPLMELYGN